MVFRTIVENIRSFFQKEEALLQEPKKVPDAASEVLGEPQHVIDKPLPKSASPKEEDTSLPFSAQQLQHALQEQRAQTSEAQPTQSRVQSETITNREIHELESEYVSDDDLLAFEETMQQLPGSAHTPRRDRPSSDVPKDGFFSTFEDFLKEGSLDKSHLDGDLLHKMRVFHQRRQEGKEPLLNEQSASNALQRRLRELQSLEHEWERMYTESRELERSMMHVEEEIEEKTRALRGLVSESEHVSLLSREVPEEQAFILANGARVRSLGGLLRAVRNDAWLFDQHVQSGRNDFAAWVASVFGNQELADKLGSALTHAQFLDVLRSS